MNLEELADEIRAQHRALFRRAQKQRGIVECKPKRALVHDGQHVVFGLKNKVRKLGDEEIASLQEYVQLLSDGRRPAAPMRLDLEK